MHLLSIFIPMILAKDVSDILSSQNQELRKVNDSLHKRLSNISKSFSVQIEEDYFYNKQRIISLITEYENEVDELVKIFLAEELLEYLTGIIEDANLLGGEIEGVPAKKLLKVFQELKKATRKCKESYFAKESAGFYNELHNVLIKKQEAVQELQSENAKLYGRIESKLAEIKETNRNWENDSKKYEEISLELNKIKSNYNIQTIQLEQGIQNEKTIRFNTLGTEDEEILNLQLKSSENSLEIEKFSAEISLLNSKVRFLTDTLQRLQSDLDSKSAQLSNNQEKFELFSTAVRSETIFQVSNIAKSEDQLHNERKDLDYKARQLSAELNNCETEAETLKSILKTKSIMIEENSKDLKGTENRQGVALEQREKEINNLNFKYSELHSRISEYQKSLDENMKKISEKATILQELQDQLRNSHKDDTKSSSYYRNEKNI